jgi:hypothetical protein
MYFQTLDDKSECVGVYVDGKLYFDDYPTNLTKTWKYSGSLTGRDIEYMNLYTNGQGILDCCPDEYKDEMRACQNKLTAYIKSFKIAKINMRDHCIFDLVPQDFLQRFCEVKNKVTQHVYENYEKPSNYEHMNSVSQLLHKIKHQQLNLSISDCKHLLTSTRDRSKVQEIIKNYKHIDYNIFGTVTGRLTTKRHSFPILTLKKELRQIIKPNNDAFVCLDYNGAEVRTLLQLNGEEQPTIDIHQWNSLHLFEQEITREECKVRFFAWLYDPTSDDIQNVQYNREKVLDKWYVDGYINTPYGRQIKVEERKALNYLLQSTTSDRVLEKAVSIDQYLTRNGCNSFISHIVHDEVVIDCCNDERSHIQKIKEIFEDGFVANVSIGKDFYNLKKVGM